MTTKKTIKLIISIIIITIIIAIILFIITKTTGLNTEFNITEWTSNPSNPASPIYFLK